MITDLRLCSGDELREQISYLAATPVRDIAGLLQSSRCTLKAGTIRSLEALGNLKTEFGQIGSAVASTSDGQQKFHVAEVLPLLEAHPELDAGMLQKIRMFMREDESGRVVFNTTIMRIGAELVLKDGNKRTIAYFERRRDWNDGTEFAVYLVEGLDGV